MNGSGHNHCSNCEAWLASPATPDLMKAHPVQQPLHCTMGFLFSKELYRATGLTISISNQARAKARNEVGKELTSSQNGPESSTARVTGQAACQSGSVPGEGSGSGWWSNQFSCQHPLGSDLPLELPHQEKAGGG